MQACKVRAMVSPRGRLLSVNVGRARRFDHGGQPAVSAIRKSPVEGRIAARGVNLDGDDQADRRVHGGPDQAVYAYATEDYRWWQRQLDRRLEPGLFGENLTTERIDVTGALVGERWKIGSTVLAVTGPRVPCSKLAARMEDSSFPRRFAKALRPGTYLRIVSEGELGAGDEIRIVERPDHGLTIGDMFRIYMRDQHEARRLLEVEQIPLGWREWAQRHGET